MIPDQPIRLDAFTIADWWAFNNRSKGYRFELIDGGLLVSPARAWTHQAAVDGLRTVLGNAAPGWLYRVSG